jgi:hypothetical protein
MICRSSNTGLLTYLMSQKNGLISVYDFSSDNGLPHSYGPPSALQTVQGGFRRMGTSFYRHTADASNDFEIFELSSEGGLLATRISVSPAEDSIGDSMDEEGVEGKGSTKAITVKRSIDRLSSPMLSKPSLEAPLSMRASVEVDLQKVYEGPYFYDILLYH